LTSVITQGPLFIVSVLVMLGIVVVIHELGHYLAGRAFGAGAESFSVGFGKSVWERRDARGTRWRVNWIPLGGFVKFVDERQLAGDGASRAGPAPEIAGKSFNELGPGERIIVALGGPAANFVLAIALFAVIALVNGTPRETLRITEVQPESPAAEAGLRPDDRVLSVNGAEIENRTDLLLPIQLGTGEPIDLRVERGAGTARLTVIPERRMQTNGVGMTQPVGTIGVGLQIERLAAKGYNPATALGHGVVRTGETISMTTDLILRMATGQEPLSNLSGPVGIGDVTRRVVNTTMGAENASLSQRLSALLWTSLQICALVSVGIGFFNLLPLPVLDGGHVVFNIYEAVAGRPLPERVQDASLTAGLILLVTMAVIVTWGDIVETGLLGGVGN